MNKTQIFLFQRFSWQTIPKLFRLNLVHFEQPVDPMKIISFLNPLPPSSSRNSTVPQDVICFLDLANTRKSGHESPMVWTRKNQNFGVETYKFDWERTMICVYTLLIWDVLAIFDFERTKNAINFLTHDSLDIGTFPLGRSRQRHFPFGTVWTWEFSVWGCLDISGIGLAPKPGLAHLGASW